MCRMDESGVYYGGNTGVRKFDLTGKQLWSAAEHVDVAFGMQTSAHVWAIGLVSADHSPMRGLIVKICKKSGQVEALIQVDALDSLSISRDGSRVYDANLNCQPVVNSSLFDPHDTTDQLPHYVPWNSAAWTDVKLPFDLMSQVVHGDCIYGVGGSNKKARLVCINLAQGALEAASNGRVRRCPTREWKKSYKLREETVDDGSSLQEVSTDDGKVIIQCVREGAKVRARVASTGYDSNLNCQFPKGLREDGARYVVDAVDLAPSGDFYRCRGAPQRYRG